MVRTVNDRDEHAIEVDHVPGEEPDTPLSDDALLDLLDTLVAERGRVPAAEVLGVNYRTLALCCDSREVSRRMRQALLDFRDAGAADEGGDVAPEVGDGNAGERDGDALERRVAALEAENAGLRELVDSQAGRLEELERLVAGMEGEAQQPASAAALDAGRHGAVDEHGDDQGQIRQEDWRPPRRRPGMPDAGVVTLEEQPDEAHAFGPAAPLVAEWRKLRTGGNHLVSRVDRTQARVRRWELETEMLRDWHLTLPPETDPLDESRRKDHVRWRREALAEAQRELSRAKRARLLRRLLTLGLWRR